MVVPGIQTRPARTAFVATALLAACVTKRVAPETSGGTSLSDMLQSQYYQSRDTTIVRTSSAALGGGLAIYASYGFQGRQMTEYPERVNLVFEQTTTGGRWRNPEGRALNLRIDDSTRVNVPDTRYRRQVIYGRPGVTAKVVEWVWAAVPREDFVRLAQASRRVRGTIAETEFTLAPDQLTAMRVMAARISTGVDVNIPRR